MRWIRNLEHCFVWYVLRGHSCPYFCSKVLVDISMNCCKKEIELKRFYLICYALTSLVSIVLLPRSLPEAFIVAKYNSLSTVVDSQFSPVLIPIVPQSQLPRPWNRNRNIFFSMTMTRWWATSEKSLKAYCKHTFVGPFPAYQKMLTSTTSTARAKFPQHVDVLGLCGWLSVGEERGSKGSFTKSLLHALFACCSRDVLSVGAEENLMKKNRMQHVRQCLCGC